MEEINNLTQDDVLELIRDFPIEPLGRKVIITTNVEQSDDGLNLSNTSLSEVQYAIAVGSHVLEFKAGQKVILDLDRMTSYTRAGDNAEERVGSIKLRPIVVNEKVYALISDSFIDCKDNR